MNRVENTNQILCVVKLSRIDHFKSATEKQRPQVWIGTTSDGSPVSFFDVGKAGIAGCADGNVPQIRLLHKERDSARDILRYHPSVGWQ